MLQLAKGGGGPKGGPAPAIPRLNVGKYSWNTECLRGDAGAGEATAFPQSIGLAASFRYKGIVCKYLNPGMDSSSEFFFLFIGH